MSNVAAAAFCPFISAAVPELFGFESWTELTKPRDLEKIFDGVEYTKWRSFRDSEDSRFVTLTMPRVLARLPYGADDQADRGVRLRGGRAGRASKPVAARPLHLDERRLRDGHRMTDAFAKYGWCTAIRGAEGGGKVEGLPAHVFTSDDGDPDLKCPTEIGITDRREDELSKLGFLPLCHYKNTDYAVFFGGQTTQKPKKYDRPEATANAAISARLPYMMATSRIAHYLKVMARDKIGSFMEATDCEDWLNRWINNYVNANAEAGQEMKAKYPLAEAKIAGQGDPRQAGLLQRGRLPAAVAAVRGADHLAADGGEHPQEVLIRGRAPVARPSPNGEAEAAPGGVRAAADGSRLPWNPPISRAMGRRPSSSRRDHLGPVTAAGRPPRPRAASAGRAARRGPARHRGPRQGDRSALDRFLAESSPWRRPVPMAGPLRGHRGPDQGRGEAPALPRHRPDRRAAQRPGQRHPPPARIPEAGGVLAGPAVPRRQLPKDANVKVRVLNVTWRELEQDLTNAPGVRPEPALPQGLRAEFGHPGGEPFGVLLGDYEVRHRRGPDHPQDDIEMLERIAEVAAAAFAPFIAGAHPSFFGIDSFTELERPLDLRRTFEQPEYLKWRSLRRKEDARFVGLTLPRILMRLPYKPDRTASRGFRFREDVEWSDRSRYLWGNSVYAFGGVLIRCFVSSGWVADIRGVRQGPDANGVAQCLDEGGLVADLHAQSFATDRRDVATKCSTDVIITDTQERELDELGFIPLCHCYDTN